MSNVVALPVRPKPQKVQHDPNAPRYYCTTCDGDAFRAFSSGRLQCVTCGAAMKNIGVTERGR